jgi:hypothetical protein
MGWNSIDLIRDDLREHAQKAHVPIVEGRLGGPAEAAERAVEGSVPEPDRSADVRPDPRLACQRKIGGELVRGSVVDEMGQLPLGHAPAVSLFDGKARPDFEVEPLVVAVDRLHHEVAVERAEQSHVHVERRTGEREDPLDCLAGSVEAEARELGEPFEARRRLRGGYAAHPAIRASRGRSLVTVALRGASRTASMSLTAGVSFPRQRSAPAANA